MRGNGVIVMSNCPVSDVSWQHFDFLVYFDLVPGNYCADWFDLTVELPSFADIDRYHALRLSVFYWVQSVHPLLHPDHLFF